MNKKNDNQKFFLKMPFQFNHNKIYVWSYRVSIDLYKRFKSTFIKIGRMNGFIVFLFNRSKKALRKKCTNKNTLSFTSIFSKTRKILDAFSTHFLHTDCV